MGSRVWVRVKGTDKNGIRLLMSMDCIGNDRSNAPKTTNERNGWESKRSKNFTMTKMTAVKVNREETVRNGANAIENNDESTATHSVGLYVCFSSFSFALLLSVSLFVCSLSLFLSLNVLLRFATCAIGITV